MTPKEMQGMEADDFAMTVMMKIIGRMYRGRGQRKMILWDLSMALQGASGVIF